MMRKKVVLECGCGAKAIFEDYTGSYINDGRKKDEQGRMYQIEIWVDNWLDIHKTCLKYRETKWS